VTSVASVPASSRASSRSPCTGSWRLREGILALLKEDEVVEGSVYKMGKRRGELETLARQYEKRLGRPLTDEERATLAERRSAGRRA
jgi:hypothetical protein